MNFVFYAFLTLGTACWGLGVKKANTSLNISDIILIVSMPIAAICYAKAAYDAKNGNEGPGKVPIYIVLSLEYAILSTRLYEVTTNQGILNFLKYIQIIYYIFLCFLKWLYFQVLNKDSKVWLFPIFSVIVNLIFISFLDKYQESTLLNPLFQ